MLRLLVTYSREEYVFDIPEEARLGSASGNDIVLRIPGVSRQHAVLRRRSGGIEVTDLNSTNRLLVAGERVERATLTPGLRIQIGSAWLEVKEASSSEEAFTRLAETLSDGSDRPSTMTTATVGPQKSLGNPSPEEAALALALHIARVGVGQPENRADLLLQMKGALGAGAIATLDTTRYGRARLWEKSGEFSKAEEKELSALARDARITARGQMIVKRSGSTLIAGRDLWFLVARFSEEAFAHEDWRKEFLRFLASQVFAPMRRLHDVDYAEASRVLALSRNNRSRAAKFLDIRRNTLYELLGLFKRKAK
jgi:pSer/pThr/pTyr-binding forkhead associated (FHA) protein